MSLDIGVGDAQSLCPIEGEPSVVLEDDGYYWFLHPLFVTLYRDTGLYIDLYGEAILRGEALLHLARMISDARNLVEAQPRTTWQVYVGTQIGPDQRDVFKTVERNRFNELLSQMETIVTRAQELGRTVVCFGD